MSLAEEPYLSVVVTSRNDNHGGDLLQRFTYFLESLLRQARVFDLAIELIIVEWNPPADRPPLREVLPIPADLGPTRIRIIELPGETHAALPNPFRIPLFQMMGKNVGIRRARGRFVLATCNDLIFSDDLFWFLARRELQPDRLYRADRLDLTVDRLPEGLSPEARMDYCARHTGMVNGHYDGGAHSLAPFPGDRQDFRSQDPETLRRFLALGEGRPVHTNACGDFTLMSREAWLAMRGYPEITLGDIYVDGLAIYQALALGLHQTILAPPMVIYHVLHGLSAGGAGIKARLKARPSLDYQEDYLPWCMAMGEAGRPLNPNGPLWGFGDRVLPETSVGG